MIFSHIDFVCADKSDSVMNKKMTKVPLLASVACCCRAGVQAKLLEKKKLIN